MARKYQEIYMQLQRDIKSGVFKNGEKLPSETQMIEKYNVSRQTIRRTLSLLEEDGLIQKAHGSGSFVQYSHRTLNTKQIAVIVPDIEDTVFPTMLRQIDASLFDHGYTASFYSTGCNVQKERAVLQKLIKTPVDGIIMLASTLTPMCVNLDLIDILRKMGTMFLFFDSWYANSELSDIPLVSIENYNGAYQVTAHLIQQKHLRIGSFYWDNPMSMMSRFSGICNALLRYNGAIDHTLFFKITSVEDVDVLFNPESIALLQSLDAFICPAAALSKTLIEVLQQYGQGNLRTIVFFDEVDVPAIDGVEYIILEHATRDLAQSCIDKILDMVNGLDVASTQLPWRLSKLSTAKNLPVSFQESDYSN